jgi:DNA polymerase-3 subunit delta'
MIVNGIYPWQEAIWQRTLADKSKLHHALLLKGQSGIGKLDFAIFLAKSLLCEQPKQDHQACGQCPSCGWFEQDNHPDFRLVSPEQDSAKDEEGAKTTKKKTQILIDQIRGLSDFLSLSSHKNDGIRVVLIHPAEGLNLSSANALLKVLEEPPLGVMFILVANQPQKILPTIMSRCQKVDMPIPAKDQAIVWMQNQGISDAEAILSYAGGSPLQASEEAEQGAIASISICNQLLNGAKVDIFQTASACLELGMENAINTLQKWCYDLLLSKMTQKTHYHLGQTSGIQKLSGQVDLSALLDFLKKLDEAKKSATHPLNNDLQLTRLLHYYTQIFKVL